MTAASGTARRYGVDAGSGDDGEVGAWSAGVDVCDDVELTAVVLVTLALPIVLPGASMSTTTAPTPEPRPVAGLWPNAPVCGAATVRRWSEFRSLSASALP